MKTHKTFNPRLSTMKWIPALAVLAAAPIALSATYTVNLADAEVERPSPNQFNDGGGNVNNAAKNGTILAGFYNSTGITIVFPFALPTIAPTETISSVNLSFTMRRENKSIPFNADLYGLGYRSTPTATSADYFIGALDTTDATLIQDNIATPSFSTSNTLHSTSSGGNLALLSYINAQYTAGAVGGDFIFLRFSVDATEVPGNVNSRGYHIFTGETATPMALTIETVAIPEPSGMAGITLFLGASLFRRKRSPRITVGEAPSRHTTPKQP